MGNFHQKLGNASGIQYLEFAMGLLSAHFTLDHKGAEGSKITEKLKPPVDAGLGIQRPGHGLWSPLAPHGLIQVFHKVMNTVTNPMGMDGESGDFPTKVRV